MRRSFSAATPPAEPHGLAIFQIANGPVGRSGDRERLPRAAGPARGEKRKRLSAEVPRMTLDVEIPEPPTLSGPQDPGDYDSVVEIETHPGEQPERDTLATALEAGAWDEAFDDWRQDTYLSEEQFRAVLDLGLIEAFDFYLNPSAGDVGYRAPAVPDDLPAPHDETFGRSDRQDVEEALDDLGRTVSEVLENDYLVRTGEEFGFHFDE